LSFFYLVSALSCFAYLLPLHKIGIDSVVVLLFLAKFGVSATFNYLFLSTSIIMHPDVVGTSFAIVNLVSRMLAIGAPEIS
jgi:hypothetical protein